MWVNNEIKGEGIKKLNNGEVQIGGVFENGHVNGKGFKKWRSRDSDKHDDVFIYRGNLVQSKINGFGVFKWPDGRHYIGEFVNAQMHGHGKMSWIESDGTKCIYKGQMFANVIQG